VIIASSRVREAFDLKKEGEAQRQRYGKYCENLLMARKLVEAGVSVVTLKLGDFDTHEKNFIDHKDQLPQLDKGSHALITDLYDRGLEKDVAVVLWGEFGRAPKISRGDGRDHWPGVFTSVLAGGGIRGGVVYGASDRFAAFPSADPTRPADLAATIYHCLGVDPEMQIRDRLDRPLTLCEGKLIQPILR